MGRDLDNSTPQKSGPAVKLSFGPLRLWGLEKHRGGGYVETGYYRLKTWISANSYTSDQEVKKVTVAPRDSEVVWTVPGKQESGRGILQKEEERAASSLQKN